VADTLHASGEIESILWYAVHGNPALESVPAVDRSELIYNLEAVFHKGEGWKLRFGFDSKTPNLTSEDAVTEKLPDNRYRFSIPLRQATRPGIDAVLRIETRPWNSE